MQGLQRQFVVAPAGRFTAVVLGDIQPLCFLSGFVYNTPFALTVPVCLNDLQMSSQKSSIYQKTKIPQAENRKEQGPAENHAK